MKALSPEEHQQRVEAGKASAAKRHAHIASTISGAQKSALLYAHRHGHLYTSTRGSKSGVDDGEGDLHEHGRVTHRVVHALIKQGLLVRGHSTGARYESVPAGAFGRTLKHGYKSILTSSTAHHLSEDGHAVVAHLLSQPKTVSKSAVDDLAGWSRDVIKGRILTAAELRQRQVAARKAAQAAEQRNTDYGRKQFGIDYARWHQENVEYNQAQRRDRKSIEKHGGHTYRSIEHIPVDQVHAMPVWNAEKTKTLRERHESGKKLEPITGEWMPDGKFHVTDGIHRTHLARELGHTHIPALALSWVERKDEK